MSSMFYFPEAPRARVLSPSFCLSGQCSIFTICVVGFLFVACYLFPLSFLVSFFFGLAVSVRIFAVSARGGSCVTVLFVSLVRFGLSGSVFCSRFVSTCGSVQFTR